MNSEPKEKSGMQSRISTNYINLQAYQKAEYLYYIFYELKCKHTLGDLFTVS